MVISHSDRYGRYATDQSQPRVNSFEAMPASAERFLLGEGPVWDAARGRLLWIDRDDGAVLIGRLDGDCIPPGRNLMGTA